MEKEKTEFSWFSFPLNSKRKTNSSHSASQLLINLVISLAIAGIFYWLQWYPMTVVVLVVSGGMTLLGFLFSSIHQKIFYGIGKLGLWISLLLQVVLLLPLLWILFPFLRLSNYFLGKDPMQRSFKKGDRNSFWVTLPQEKKQVNVKVPYSREYIHRNQGSLKIFLFLGIFLVAIFGIGEVLLQWNGFGNPVLYISPLEIGYMPKPNQELSRRGGRISINQFGMRSDPVSLEKPPDTYRLFFIGDSTLYAGSYIDQPQMFSERVKEILNRNKKELPGSPKKVEVLTLGVNGWGGRHKLAYLKKYGLFQADHLIVVLPLGDITRPQYGLYAMPFFHANHSPTLAWEELSNHLAWRYHTARVEDNKNRNDPQWVQDGIQKYREIGLIAQKAGIKVHYLIMPSEGEVKEGKGKILDPLFPPFKSTMEKEGFSVISPLTTLVQHQNDPFLYHDIAHIGQSGHKFVADFIAQEVFSISP